MHLLSPAAESDPNEDICELWNEDESELSQDLKDQDEEEPQLESEIQIETIQGQSRALAIWLHQFMLCIQAVFHISDNALSFCIRFFKVFFSVLGRFCKVSAEIAECLPSSLYAAKVGINQPKFRKYVVCKKCHKIYFFSDCIEGPRMARTSRLCPFKPFPNHRQERMRRPCGTVLLKTVELASGVRHLYPRLTYCYLGVKVPLQSFLQRPGFYETTELWRSRQASSDDLCDIYDGKVWSDFQVYAEQPFLSEPGNFALMLNMDFFQPYKHIQYSLGAIYLTILNLPRGTRNKSYNVILVGLIPGPHEPQHDINSFLEPLVNELLDFWKGIEMDIHSLGIKKVRCALVCVACDLPAGRKTCGFLNFNARFGCSRCWKKFSGSVGSMDYSGFDRENWHERTAEEHRVLVSSLQCKTTKRDLEKAESESGCRFSVLLQLPYFDPPRMLIIDPMHNLFLGSAKYFMKSLILGRGLISESDIQVIQKRMDNFTVPADIGRIPHKIATGFSSFTADQWKNWVLYFSLISMRDILDSDTLECWRHFVQGCRVLSTRKIRVEKVLLGDAHLVQFCKRTQRIFGNESMTPNMHMHFHLRSCIMDYGPLHGFWLYAFERYNGLLGAIPNNNHSIEMQIMQRFVRDNEVYATVLPEEFSDDFGPLFPKHMQAVGSLADTLISEPAIQPGAVHSPGLIVDLPKNCVRKIFSQVQIEFLTELYADLYKVSRSDLTLSTCFTQYSSARINEKLFGTHHTRTTSSSVAIAAWDSSLFGLPSNPCTSSLITRPVRINSFCKHSFSIDGESKTHLLADVSWFKCHPKNTNFGKPTTVWYYDLFESPGIHTFLPVQFLQCRAVSLIDTLDNESVLFVCSCII